LHGVLCGCETWSSTQIEEHKLRLLEKRVLSRTLGQRGCDGRLEKTA
jgi:hypothetical protein